MFRLFALYRGAFNNIQRNVWLLSVAMFINRSGSMVLLFTSLYLTKELHFSIAQAGVALSFYGIGSVLGSYSGGWLTDRKNYFDIMLFSLFSSGLVLFLMLLVETPFQVSLVMFMYSFLSDMFRPANSKAIAANSTPLNRTRSVSLVRLAVNLGFSIGPAAGGFIALYFGYKWLFILDSITSFAAACMLLIYFSRNAAATEHLRSGASERTPSAYTDLQYLLFILLVAFFGVAFFQLFASIPQYFNKVCHYNEGTIGLLLALNGALVVLIEMPLVASLEKYQKIFPFIITGVLCIPVALLILLFGKGMMGAAILYTLIITFSEIFAMPFMMNFALSRPAKERQGQYSALYSISYGLANTAAPILGLGIAARYGFDKMFWFFIVLSLFTAIGFFFLGRSQKPVR